VTECAGESGRVVPPQPGPPSPPAHAPISPDGPDVESSADRTAQAPNRAPSTPAAVLLPFHRDAAGELRLILIKRTPRGRHGDQISLPGGKYEPTDASMRATAIRETCEELGIPAETIEVLDELSPRSTRSTGFRVWPFVGRLRAVPGRWQPQQSEVASVLDLAVSDLVDPARRGTEKMYYSTWKTSVTVPVWRIDGHPIWGLTLRILEPVLPRVLAGEWPL
jgi:8-oxo-dGTP pyrophosphatase MutT (NUDIX family)